ncbi:MAG: response regulator, partial [Methylocella sp.]
MSQESDGSPAAGAPADDAAHLLIVDDDRRIRALLSRVLSDEGYRVTTAADAAEAMARLKSLSFDLIV